MIGMKRVLKRKSRVMCTPTRPAGEEGIRQQESSLYKEIMDVGEMSASLEVPVSYSP